MTLRTESRRALLVMSEQEDWAPVSAIQAGLNCNRLNARLRMQYLCRIGMARCAPCPTGVGGRQLYQVTNAGRDYLAGRPPEPDTRTLEVTIRTVWR